MKLIISTFCLTVEVQHPSGEPGGGDCTAEGEALEDLLSVWDAGDSQRQGYHRQGLCCKFKLLFIKSDDSAMDECFL